MFKTPPKNPQSKSPIYYPSAYHSHKQFPEDESRNVDNFHHLYTHRKSKNYFYSIDMFDKPNNSSLFYFSNCDNIFCRSTMTQLLRKSSLACRLSSYNAEDFLHVSMNIGNIGFLKYSEMTSLLYHRTILCRMSKSSSCHHCPPPPPWWPPHSNNHLSPPASSH